MRRLLYRLFPDLAELSQLRQDNADLRAQVDMLTRDRDRLEVLLEAAQTDRSRMWDVVNHALKDAAFAYQSSINLTRGLAGMPQPYPEASVLPERVLPHEEDPFGRSIELSSERQVRLRNEWVKNAVEKRRQDWEARQTG